MKFGRKPAVHTPRRMRAQLALGAHLDALGPPPAATYNRNPVRAKLGPGWYQMYGNDEFGDCVFVDSGNTVPFLLAIAGGPIVVPTLDDVLGAYSAVTGFVRPPPGGVAQNDDGTDENSAIAYLRSTGLAGHRIDDAAPIDPTNIDHVKWAITLFKLRPGLAVSADYIQAFEARQPWTTALPPGPEGHDAPFLDYDPNGVYLGTWGRDDQFVPWDKVVQPGFVEELHAELWFDVIRDSGLAPDGLSLDQLDADLRALGPEEARYTQNVTTRSDVGAVEAARHGFARSDHWPTVEREVRKASPRCIGCADGDPDYPVQVHHVHPFHYVKALGRGDLELTPSNLISLCETERGRPGPNHHLHDGHLGNFKEGNLLARDDALGRYHGMSDAAIRADPDYAAEERTGRLKALDAMSRDEKVAYRRRLDEEFPVDGEECRAVVARFPEAAPTPFDEWEASLPPD